MATKEEQTKAFVELIKGYSQYQKQKQKRSVQNKRYYQKRKAKERLSHDVMTSVDKNREEGK